MARTISKADLERAYALSAWERSMSPQLSSARYDAERHSLVLGFEASSAVLLVPVAEMPELAGASAEALAEVSLSGPMALWWPSLDVDVEAKGLIFDMLLPPEWRDTSRRNREAVQREAASLAGQQRSPAKTAAARSNGKKGGRPRKATPPKPSPNAPEA